MTKPTSPALTSALTAAQTAIVATAFHDPHGALRLPQRLKGKAASALVASLIAKGAAREVRAKGGLPAWRRDEVTRIAYALVITKAGRAAVSPAHPQPQAAAVATSSAPSTVTRAVQGGDQQGAMPPAELATPERAEPAPTDMSDSYAISGSPRPESKLSGIVGLLGREAGASMDELIAATGWLPHTTRAALTGLRKRGYTVTREVGQAGSVYRISAAAQSPAA